MNFPTVKKCEPRVRYLCWPHADSLSKLHYLLFWLVLVPLQATHVMAHFKQIYLDLKQ